MSETKFVFAADSADLVRQSKSVAAAAKQIEAAHIAAGKAANTAAENQTRSLKQIAAEEKRLAMQMRRERLDAARRATSILPGGIGQAAARGLAGSPVSTGAIGGTAAALGGVAIAATALVGAFKVYTSVLRRNTELQTTADRAASGSVGATATAEQEFVKNAGAMAFAGKQRIVGLEIPQLQRELKIAGFDDLTRAVGAAISAGGSAPLAVDATRQAARLYPFSSAAVQDAAPQLALIAKALGDNNAQLAAGIVLKTNEFSPIKDIGQLAQALPSILSASRRLGVSDSEFKMDAKFAADLFANIASETADKSGEETKTLLRTLIPLINRFFAERGDVGGSLQNRFRQLTANATDRAAFLGTAGVPGGSQRDTIEKLFTAGSPLNTNVTSTADAFLNLNGAVEEYYRQITELTATTKIAVQQQRLALEQESRNRDPGAQARGTLRDILEQARGAAFSDDQMSIGSMAANRLFFEKLLDSDAFAYGSSERVNEQLQTAIDRMISSLQTGGVTPLEQQNILTLQNLKDIANQTTEVDRSSRGEAARDSMDLAALDRYEKSLPRGKNYQPGLRDELAQRDALDRRFGIGPGNRVAEYDRRQGEMDLARNNALRNDIPTDPIDRQIRLDQIAALEAYRAAQAGLPGAIGAVGDNFNSEGVERLGRAIGDTVAGALAESIKSLRTAGENLARSGRPAPGTPKNQASSDRAANR